MTTPILKSATDTDTPKTARQEHYEDILVTAVEGGSNHWASFRKYDPLVTHTVEVAAVDDFSAQGMGGNSWKLVSAKQVGSALALMSRGGGYSPNSVSAPEWWVRKWRLAYRDCADGSWDYDAGDADCILQVAVLGEVVYG